MRPHNYLNVMVERREKPHQPFDRIFAEVSLEEARHFGLADAHPFSGVRLRQLARVRKAVDFRHHLRLEEMRVRVRQAEIGKDVFSLPFVI